jgi:hypothetical protein
MNAPKQPELKTYEPYSNPHVLSIFFLLLAAHHYLFPLVFFLPCSDQTGSKHGNVHYRSNSLQARERLALDSTHGERERGNGPCPAGTHQSPIDGTSGIPSIDQAWVTKLPDARAACSFPGAAERTLESRHTPSSGARGRSALVFFLLIDPQTAGRWLDLDEVNLEKTKPTCLDSAIWNCYAINSSTRIRRQLTIGNRNRRRPGGQLPIRRFDLNNRSCR